MCKFWLEPIALSKNRRFSPRELNRIRRIILGLSLGGKIR
ncbi:MAG: hypothetical protein QGM50_08745 [Anaerolineae bacterium]|nr:hypothetical protein [Anaerolineae bacterium]